MLAAFPMSNTEADCWIADMYGCQIVAEFIHEITTITTIADRMDAIVYSRVYVLW